MRLTVSSQGVILGTLLLLSIDQASKYMIRVGGFPYVMNQGSVGGLGATWHIQVWVWIVVSCLVLVALWGYFKAQSASRYLHLARGVLTAGILGNLIDRIWHHAVIDFLDISIGWFHWPLFNIADVYLVAGAVLLLTSFPRK